SLPNDIAATSGVRPGRLGRWASDCNATAGCLTRAQSLFGQGPSWGAYAESMQKPRLRDHCGARRSAGRDANRGLAMTVPGSCREVRFGPDEPSVSSWSSVQLGGRWRGSPLLPSRGVVRGQSLGRSRALARQAQPTDGFWPEGKKAIVMGRGDETVWTQLTT